MIESQRNRFKRRRIERAERRKELENIKLNNLLTYYACVQEIAHMANGETLEDKTPDEIHAEFTKFESRLKRNAAKTIVSYGDGFVALYFARDNVLAHSQPLSIEDVLAIIEESMPTTDVESPPRKDEQEGGEKE